MNMCLPLGPGTYSPEWLPYQVLFWQSALPTFTCPESAWTNYMATFVTMTIVINLTDHNGSGSLPSVTRCKWSTQLSCLHLSSDIMVAQNISS